MYNTIGNIGNLYLSSPIVNKNFISQYKPDIIIILVWNLKKEVMKKLKYIKKWNGKFVTFIPNLKIY